ncbi:MAG TPA: hypothetical protein VH637_04190 [Streptosporangiaceae bacterium]|jgi:hypothetical protein
MGGSVSGVFLIGVFAAAAALCGVLINRFYRAGAGQAARLRGGKARPGGD